MTARCIPRGGALALARWMTAPGNPLVARVIVNRIWQWYFGEGLVASENDFGVAGERPSYPELLDYLATELRQSGWSLKHLHRLIAKSAAFRLSAQWDAAAAARSMNKRLIWRWQPRRLEAEAVRDSMLAISGGLNTKRGGPSIFPELPQAVLDGQSAARVGLGNIRGRRSGPPKRLYLHQAQRGRPGAGNARLARHHVELRAPPRLDHRPAGVDVPEWRFHARPSRTAGRAAAPGSGEPIDPRRSAWRFSLL